ncbi:MAG TPA: NAD(P)-dependent oxidoreductase, partial [Mycobacteriales bacterium]|nr:NAD(P)-dependent oxidoreductase [Mycobacteriales bacterium]
MTTVAFLGLGRMGVPLATHVVRAGHELRVWNRSPGRAAPMVELGASEAKTIGDAVAGAEIVVLMLFGPDAVREVLPSVVKHADAALVVDASTIGPEAAHEFARTCAAGGLRYVDAPVAGSVKPATDGTLGVFLGGAATDVAQARTITDLWADPARVFHVGGVGSASAVKLCVNQALGFMAAGLGESLRLGRDLGLDRGELLQVLSKTAYAWYLDQKRPMVENGDYSATTFSLDLLAKDLALAVDAADSDLSVTRAVLAHAQDAL